jgi:hypothetical protein
MACSARGSSCVLGQTWISAREMPTVLFWNTFRKALPREIADLCHECAADILILAESRLDTATFLPLLNDGQRQVYTEPLNPSSKLRIFTRLPQNSVQLIADLGGISIRRIAPPVGQDFILVAVHFIGKTAYKELDQAFQTTRLNNAIQSAELRAGHSRTVLVGDFNMNPFEAGVVSSDGVHAVMDRRIALQGSRIVSGERCDFFYNPMWSRMGPNASGPPGTYYYRDSTHVTYFWNTFDQVMVRPALIDFLPENHLHVVSSISGNTLLRANGTPNRTAFSDHLPLVFKLETEKALP